MRELRRRAWYEGTGEFEEVYTAQNLVWLNKGGAHKPQHLGRMVRNLWNSNGAVVPLRLPAVHTRRQQRQHER